MPTPSRRTLPAAIRRCGALAREALGHGVLVLDCGAAQAATRKLRNRRLRAKARRALTAQMPLTIAGVALPFEDEFKHLKCIGTTGIGKSTVIRELLHAALGRGDRAVIADPDGGYLSRFYDPGRGDVIGNPFDLRSAKWDLFAELRNAYDVDELQVLVTGTPAVRNARGAIPGSRERQALSGGALDGDGGRKEPGLRACTAGYRVPRDRVLGAQVG